MHEKTDLSVKLNLLQRGYIKSGYTLHHKHSALQQHVLNKEFKMHATKTGKGLLIQ